MRRGLSLLACVAALGTTVAPGEVHAQDKGDAPPPAPKLTKAPKLVHFEEADYPESEKAAGRAASVTLEIAVAANGTVSSVRVVGSASAAFDAAAVAAAKKFVFEPAEIDHKPAPVKLTYRYDFVLKEEPKGPVVNLEGVVRDRFSKKPLQGVTITVEGAGDPVVTDDAGHFEFKDVPAGKHQVTIAGPGLTTMSTEETIEAGKKLDVKYTVEPKEEGEGEGSDLEIVVVAPKLQKEVVSTEIKVEEGRRVAGTGGDTLKVVQNLPGVARAAFGSGALIVWGAAPQDTRVYVDGVRTWSARSISRPAAGAPSSAAGSGGSSRSRRVRRSRMASTATPPPTSSTRRRWSRHRSAIVRAPRSRVARATSIGRSRR